MIKVNSMNVVRLQWCAENFVCQSHRSTIWLTLGSAEKDCEKCHTHQFLVTFDSSFSLANIGHFTVKNFQHQQIPLDQEASLYHFMAKKWDLSKDLCTQLFYRA